ncbi:MAG: GIY-YIG nuclease family protein, partial [Bacteroidales bacterium]
MIEVVIYKIENMENGKKYIGQSIDFNKRIAMHKYHSKIEEKKHYPLYRAVAKYGWDKFKIEIIENCTSKDDMNEKEKAIITMYNSTSPNFGYNVQAGGTDVYSERLSVVLKKSKENGTFRDIRVINVTDNIIYRSG